MPSSEASPEIALARCLLAAAIAPGPRRLLAARPASALATRDAVFAISS